MRRDEAVAWLAPRMAGLGRAAEALEAVRAISDDARRAAALTELAPALDPPRREESLRKALAIRRRISEAGALVDLFPRLPDALLPEALEAVRALTDDRIRAAALAALIPRLMEPLLGQASGAVLVIRDAVREAERLAPQESAPDEPTTPVFKVSPGQNPEEQEALVSLSLACDEALSALTARFAALGRLGQALELGLTIHQDWLRVEALLELVEERSFGPDQWAAIVSSIRSAKSVKLRSFGLGRLAPHLPDAGRAAVQLEARSAAETVPNGRHQVEALGALAALSRGAIERTDSG